MELSAQLAEQEIEERLPRYDEILEQNLIREKCDHDNFLSPESIEQFNKA